jgi:hypothetical protein
MTQQPQPIPEPGYLAGASRRLTGQQEAGLRDRLGNLPHELWQE